MIKNKLFCITGGLENFPLKKDAYEEIRHHGGNTTDSIKNTCNFLILGAKGNPNYSQGEKGNKQLKAETWAAQGHPIKVISENQFVGMLEACEELSEESWGVDVSGESSSRPSIERNLINGIEISKLYWTPKPNIRQVLRVEFKSHRSDEEIIELWRPSLQKTKSILGNHNLKNSVRTEVIPATWFDGAKSCDDEDVILSCRIIALLETPEERALAQEIAEDITNSLFENEIEGKLSLRIWDETYRYGRHWIKKLI